GLRAQWRLQEAGGGLRAAGDSVTLSCHVSGFTFDHYDIWWYRQAPGGSLEWVSLISITSDNKSAPAMEGQALVSRDNSRSKSTLSLWALSPRNSARYFCAISHG
ncbi:HV03 protein, partial [Acrocephalus arundinaceus]|nr:HV03 protein [Acrocephalus arundinaceus]